MATFDDAGGKYKQQIRTPDPPMKKPRYLLHIILFLGTVFTTVMAGAEHIHGGGYFLFNWLNAGTFSWAKFADGWLFSFSFLAFLTCHEFGHYFAALYHGVRTSLPYYIPVFIPGSMLNIGSFGAVIRFREMPPSRRKYFDIGGAGPLAGFVVSVILLVVGFTTLPDLYNYVGQIHPVFTDIEAAKEYSGELALVGTNLLYDGMAWLLADPDQLPPAWEVMHYPLLFAGYLTLFFTALNLLPNGQLDGGHVVYGLFGRKIHGWVRRGAVLGLVVVGGTGVPDVYGAEIDTFTFVSYGLYLGLLFLVWRRVLNQAPAGLAAVCAVGLFGIQFLTKQMFPEIETNFIWLVYAFFSVAFVGMDHPGALDERPLDTRRKFLGYLALAIFILCYSISPLSLA